MFLEFVGIIIPFLSLLLFIAFYLLRKFLVRVPMDTNMPALQLDSGSDWDNNTDGEYVDQVMKKLIKWLTPFYLLWFTFHWMLVTHKDNIN